MKGVCDTGRSFLSAVIPSRLESLSVGILLTISKSLEVSPPSLRHVQRQHHSLAIRTCLTILAVMPGVDTVSPDGGIIERALAYNTCFAQAIKKESRVLDS